MSVAILSTRGIAVLSPTGATVLWQPGPPSHVTPETQAIDRRVCKRLKCSRCGKRGLEYRPLHLGSRYRVRAECACGHAEEV